MYKLGTLFIIGTCCFLAACSVGPDYIRPPANVPLTYKEADVGTWKVAAPETVYNRGCWWEIFKDDLLNDLERQATKSNPSIAVALAQYEQALAIVNEAIAGFFPVVSVSVADTETATKTPATNLTRAKTTKTNVAPLSIQATWQVDLWGSVRRLVEEDEALAESDAALLAGVKLSIQSTLAQAYFQLRALDEAQDAYDESVKEYEKYLRITRNQHKAGTASQLATLQAEAQLDAIKVLAVDNYILRAQLEHAIAVLVNKAPSQLSITRIKTKLAHRQFPWRCHQLF